MRYRSQPFKRRSPLRGLLVLAIALLIAARLVMLGLPRLHQALAGTLFGDATSAVPVNCHTSNPLAGAYSPSRLALHAGCVSAVGRVVFVLHAPDGDIHISLLPDRGYWHLLDRRNYTAQGGTLVVEIVPADRKTVALPGVGDHVRVTGAYVTDREHGWRELHPAWQIVNV